MEDVEEVGGGKGVLNTSNGLFPNPPKGSFVPEDPKGTLFVTELAVPKGSLFLKLFVDEGREADPNTLSKSC
jgi:hypothetical protein